MDLSGLPDHLCCEISNRFLAEKENDEDGNGAYLAWSRWHHDPDPDDASSVRAVFWKYGDDPYLRSLVPWIMAMQFANEPLDFF